MDGRGTRLEIAQNIADWLAFGEVLFGILLGVLVLLGHREAPRLRSVMSGGVGDWGWLRSARRTGQVF